MWMCVVVEYRTFLLHVSRYDRYAYRRQLKICIVFITTTLQYIPLAYWPVS
jgi:hypothetical protein